MLDPKRVRTQTEEIARRLAIKNFEFDTATFEQLEERRRATPGKHGNPAERAEQTVQIHWEGQGGR